MANLKKEVIENAKTPNRPNEILERSEHGSILWRKLLECWVYQAEARITAKEMLHFVRDVFNFERYTMKFSCVNATLFSSRLLCLPTLLFSTSTMILYVLSGSTCETRAHLRLRFDCRASTKSSRT